MPSFLETVAEAKRSLSISN